ncbi:MAG: M20/M25/M40 family metallo-hydrolase, partial [Desulfobacteraceae bacterium]|nr:M20/M25/M40 family metallo-hydrolase [Desulfobacteraceae bacterium]
MALSQSMNLKKEIHTLFRQYVNIPSYTNTAREKLVEPFLESWFQAQKYFRNHPKHWGKYPLNDPLDRYIIWGMAKGKGKDTIVLIHHYDVVDIDEYESVQSHAHDIDEINSRILSMAHKFDPEAVDDLKSGQWQFGRGTADMKAGGAIQLALLKKYSLKPDFKGNVIVMALPDEENLSAGMRSAVRVLSELKELFHLNYRLMINSEPHQSTSAKNGIVYHGSVGKLMPIVYCRGSLAHVGRIFEGLNPLHLMSELVTQTELNMTYSDVLDEEATAPPSWLYFKDRKQHYDVSIPTAVCGYLSITTLKTSPDTFLQRLKESAKESFATVINRMNQSYEKYLTALGQPVKKLPWQ